MNAAPPPSAPPTAALEEIRALVDDACYLSAWKKAAGYAPLRSWEGALARNTAARLAANLGDQRLSRALHHGNARRHPHEHVAFLGSLLASITRRGPMEMLERLEHRLAAAPPADPLHRAELLAIRGWGYGRLRDFEPAHRAIAEAVALAPRDGWVRVQHASVLELEDRYEESLEVAREALALGPGRPPAVSQVVDCLIHLGRDDEAFALLRSAHERGEAACFAANLIHLLSEREDHAGALAYLDEFVRRSPLLDKDGREWSTRRRADFLYLAGDYDGALAECDKLPEGYHRKVAASMREPGALLRGRRRLGVPFVRQHNMTCAPATLAALAAYWGLKFDHLAISEAICYSGTPWHKERLWAEENGFIAAEFRFTREILVALIDRGVPFTLCTESVTSAHLQACIGYDERQGVALLRDPTERHFGEILISGLIETHPVQGPRCMLLLPEAEAARIDGLTLPDAAVYDAFHRMLLALDRHDRKAAREALTPMPADHPLRLWAEFRLAGYDRNPAAELAAIDPLVARFPENAPLRFYQFGVLQRVNDRPRQQAFLQAELAREACDPVFYSEMGEWLMRDARRLPMADYYLRKAIRLRSFTAQVYSALAYCRWLERRFADSARYRRVAACLEEGWESYAAAYAECCRVAGQPAEGLDFLRARVARLGAKSGGPWQTLAEELDAQERTPEAFTVFESGMAARPEDGALMLAAGRQFIFWGQPERGETLMQCARGKVHEAQWLSAMVSMESALGRRREAITHSRSLLELEPYSISAYRTIARLLAEEEGTPRPAIAFLEEATGRHPHLPALWELKAEWDAVEHGPASAIPPLEKALALDPDNVWTLRDLAIRRHRAGESARALEECREAIGKDPQSPLGHRVLGLILEDLHRVPEAMAACRQALTLSVDDTPSAARLVALAPDTAAKKEALAFLEAEMHRQVSNGEIVTEYRALAYQHLEPELLLDQLRGFCDARPDLWQTWAARATQALTMGHGDEALECASTLTERFPLLPRAWVELGRTRNRLGDYSGEVEALGNAIRLSPGWTWAARQLAAALERTGRIPEALETLERALHHDPLTGENYGYLADLLWKMGRRTEAFERLLEGMKRSPGYQWGWETLASWATTLERQGEVLTVVEAHHPREGHRPDWWTLASDLYNDLNRWEDALATLETGLQRHPDHPDLLEQKAHLLALRHRFDEALAACERGLALHPRLRTLAGRQAWVLMESGHPNEAIRQMTALVGGHPDYLWAIRQLARWLNDRGRWEELRDLARGWVRQVPDAAVAWGNLGQAHRNLDQAAEAKAAFAKAFALDPEYAFAGRTLLSCQIAEGAFDEAAATLQTLEHYIPSAMVCADAVELAVARKDRAEALRKATQLLEDPEAEIALLSWMPRLFAQGGWLADWWKRLDSMVRRNPSPSPALVEAWVRSFPERRRHWCAPWLIKRLPRNPPEPTGPRVHAWLTLLDLAAPATRSRYGWWIAWNRRWLRSRTDLWEAAGNALTETGNYRKADQWLASWKERGEAVGAAALFNYGVAAESRHGWKAAAQVRETALERYPATPLSNALRAVVALQRSLQGDPEGAAALAAEVESDKLSVYYGTCFTLHRCLAAAHRKAWDDARHHYQSALQTYNNLQRERSMARLFADVSGALAASVPEAKGSARRLRRRWGKYTGKGGAGFLRLGLMMILFVLLRVLLEALK